MTHLTHEMLLNMRACLDARRRFQKLFGDWAEVTLDNVRKFAGKGNEGTNYGWCSWMIRVLLDKVTQDIRSGFYRRTGGCGFSTVAFDRRRAKALYQLLKAVEI